jgi:hypothetical protein
VHDESLCSCCLQVGATLDVYESVQKQLLPTPTKSHYTFNLRDVSKVFQVSCYCCCSSASLLSKHAQTVAHTCT